MNDNNEPSNFLDRWKADPVTRVFAILGLLVLLLLVMMSWG